MDLSKDLARLRTLKTLAGRIPNPIVRTYVAEHLAGAEKRIRKGFRCRYNRAVREVERRLREWGLL